MNPLKGLNEFLNNDIDYIDRTEPENPEEFFMICWEKLEKTGGDEYYWGYEMITYIKKYSNNRCELEYGVLRLIEQYVKLYVKNNKKKLI